MIYCHLAYLTYMQSTSCEMLDWMNHKLGRNINNLKDDTTLMAEREEELKMRVKEESEKPGLKLNIQKTKIMTSGPITSWQIGGGKVETMTDLFSWVPKSLDSDCSHEIKRCLLLGRKPREHIKKQRHYFANKGLSSQSYAFSSSHVRM